ncbi:MULTISPECIES: tetratricopeptide repeat protein [Cellvibrio]|uniref:TolA-binding protein n=1 Tax=Cellvibrio fibrivorans TaxID=126350 RepID=A0ABU1V1J6_9GAMM|nr:tetratricopeptide repeat protein [Cellvibrio fibrivorans]MDR7091316.1 TolA-binding protein [Cellvibrio fibrivorans]
MMHLNPSLFRHTLMALAVSAVLQLQGCSMIGLGDDERGKTLADLPAAKIPDAKAKVAVLDMARIEQSYQRALSAAEDPALRQQIMVRLADLEMARSEKAQLDSTDMRRHYDKPVAMYSELLKMQATGGRPVKGIEADQLRYKLAKAMSLDGRSAEAAVVLDQLADTNPDSKFMAETQFRRAEKSFADGDYAAAERNYDAVVKGNNPELQQNALYMKGWAQFKRGDYDLALNSFAKVLDQLIGHAKNPNDVDAALTDIGASKANLVKDTLRVMGLSLSYLEGAKSISDLQTQLGGGRAYEYLLYQQLGQLYLDQKRFTDSAETYQHYVQHNSNSDFAPSFSIKVIDVYQQGDFPSLILPAKQDFVERYGISSNYWTQRKGAIGDNALAYLHQSLQELAQFEHAQAQSFKRAKPADATAAFGRAAKWYREFVQTFAKDAQVAEMTFLLAECLNEAGDLPAAMDAYEQVAYGYMDKLRGADAGYAAILLPQQLVQSARSLPDTRLQEWQNRKIQNALNFADVYNTDPRAVVVLAEAANDLLQQNRYVDAKMVAERVIEWQPPAEGKLLFSSWLILGHSRFETKEYAAAEQAYVQVLNLLPAYGKNPGAPSAQQVRERIAASIYQQADASLQFGDKDSAIAQLLRITQVTPDTEIAAKAQYDAGVYLIEQEKWAQAENVYLGFRKKYPNHQLISTLPAKMVLIYQNQSKWQLAADELVVMERTSTDPDVKRQSLYMGAELYEKSGKRAQAIEQYRRYATEYARPLANNLEAQFKLTELYGAAGDKEKRLFWLQNIINTHNRAGNAKTDRSTYLAASAQAELSQPAYDEFTRIQLTLPLKTSLQRKRAALEKALKAQEQVLAFGVSEFTTEASFKIGEIYAQLSRDLMNSQRPKDLDELALEQYEILLEEQAYPFEEKAIEIHQTNAQRSWKGTYDAGVKRSFDALAKLLPARYNKTESRLEVSNEIH